MLVSKGVDRVRGVTAWAVRRGNPIQVIVGKGPVTCMRVGRRGDSAVDVIGCARIPDRRSRRISNYLPSTQPRGVTEYFRLYKPSASTVYGCPVGK